MMIAVLGLHIAFPRLSLLLPLPRPAGPDSSGPLPPALLMDRARTDLGAKGIGEAATLRAAIQAAGKR